MINFTYSIPTRIFFGRNQIEVLGKQIINYGSKVLLVYGGRSIKKIGLYDKVVNVLQESDISFWELSGVEPNPRITSVRKGVELCKENSIDLVLAVGGGSSIDCAKVIAAGANYEGDAWDIVLDPTGLVLQFSHHIGWNTLLMTVLWISLQSMELMFGAWMQTRIR